jgi:hypothetical protein
VVWSRVPAGSEAEIRLLTRAARKHSVSLPRRDPEGCPDNELGFCRQRRSLALLDSSRRNESLDA